MLIIMQTTSDPGKGTDWLVLPHGPIQELSENLWRVEGDLPHFSMKRVMTVARLQTGALLIHSAIALDEASMKRLEAWGTPAILLVPHVRHRMDAARFKRRYPSLRVFAPPGVMAKAQAVVHVDGTYSDVPSDPALTLELLDGTGEMEGAMLVRSSDGTSVVLTEVVFDLEPPRARSLARRSSSLALGLGRASPRWSNSKWSKTGAPWPRTSSAWRPSQIWCG